MRELSGFDIEGVDIGIAVSLGTLREVLKCLSVDGKKWWIACDPTDALETNVITIAHGQRGCVDRLNALYFDVPVLNDRKPEASMDRLVLLLDSSVISAVGPGLYLENGRVLEDPFADLECMYQPIRELLVARLQRE